MKFLAILTIYLGFFFTILLLSAVSALPVKWLWNDLMPDIFKLPQITFLQAWGLSLLSGFLFKSSTTSTSKN